MRSFARSAFHSARAAGVPLRCGFCSSARNRTVESIAHQSGRESSSISTAAKQCLHAIFVPFAGRLLEPLVPRLDGITTLDRLKREHATTTDRAGLVAGDLGFDLDFAIEVSTERARHIYVGRRR